MGRQEAEALVWKLISAVVEEVRSPLYSSLVQSRIAAQQELVKALMETHDPNSVR